MSSHFSPWIAIICAATIACNGAAVARPSSTPAWSNTVAATPSASPVSSSSSLAVASMEFVSEQVGWVATYFGPLYRTAGTGWIALQTPRDGPVEMFDFVGTQIGWGIAHYARGAQYGCAQAAPAGIPPCRSALLFTQDGGATWDERLVLPLVASANGSLPMRGLVAIDHHTLWLLVNTGGDSEVRLTVDGARSWRTVLAMPGLTTLEADGKNGAWVIAATATGSDVLRTTDGGRHWTRALSGKAYALTRVGSELWVLDRDGAYCTSSNCSEYRLRHSADGGTSWTDLGNPKVSATCTRGHLGRPSFSDRDLLTGYIPISLGAGGVQGGEGGLLVTGDGGRSWRCETTPPNVTRVAAVMGTAYAVSRDRVLGTDSVWRQGPSGWTRTLP